MKGWFLESGFFYFGVMVMRKKPEQFPVGDDEVMNVRAVAAWLDRTPLSISRLAQRGRLPFRKWGRRMIFYRKEIEAFFQELEGRSVDEAVANCKREGE